MMTHLKNNGYVKGDDRFMLMSGGDHNTGGALASITEGDAQIAVMNEMGFTASAIGNHEMDWGLKATFNQKGNATFLKAECCAAQRKFKKKQLDSKRKFDIFESNLLC